ncbi:mandelate racemase/muconate lactonizing enzyme family protein [Halocynthiibacter sp. C4]|uniref:mandelate racemase/muconate lactonizing enzyme family protein n=1 Tax=Halocynthiibacter sp. C4 TaxID=2992758 RepID=UPI00237B4F87|nr:mandelate racemase/muconate lactonizing enzyme family protein [Halocynthiibacter sp. C4]MDE0591571.1 mandelate racemase/muconate lactonizing enzyme family protein [Halocynthiibacter sp. C4]
MPRRIEKLEVFAFDRQTDRPYLGDTANGVVDLGPDYFVRQFNGTIYPKRDRSIVVCLTDSDGAQGWGETYGLVAPKAVVALIDDLFGSYLKTLDPDRPDQVWDKLYELQRVRGYWGGFLGDALAALDIALWDLAAKSKGESIQSALGRKGGGQLAGYVSGLPPKTRQERVDLAVSWKERGFDSVKLPIGAVDDGDVVGEMNALRDALGDEHRISLDIHWTKTAKETIELDAALQGMNPWFLEAPTKPEDIAAQQEIAQSIKAPLALGEEWRTEWDYRYRTDACHIIQPEMGHTGITQFMRMGRMAQEHGAEIIPHATIGLGIFMAASLRASLAAGASSHEFQHTIYHRNAALLEGAASCENGYFEIPDTPGHGVTPNDDAFQYLTPIKT